MPNQFTHLCGDSKDVAEVTYKKKRKRTQKIQINARKNRLIKKTDLTVSRLWPAFQVLQDGKNITVLESADLSSVALHC